MTLDALDVESALDALLAEGHSRTRATQLVIERTLTASAGASTVVVVEGLSDQIALEVVAGRCGRVLADEGIAVVPMGGATNIGRVLTLVGEVRLAGLYDVAQERLVARSLGRAGFDLAAGLEALGFFACDADLEDELIRALGMARVEQVLEAEGELASFRRMTQQPSHRGGVPEQQVRRFVSARSGHKYRYARVFAEGLDLDRLPPPLADLLAHL